MSKHPPLCIVGGRLVLPEGAPQPGGLRAEDGRIVALGAYVTPQPGDRVVVVPAGRLGMPDGYSFPVAEVEEGHHLVLRQAPPQHPWDAVWTFVVEPDGEGRSRLISRSRSARPTGPAALPLRGVTAMMDPVTLVMTRRMLLGIKERAER